jgi:hypothetical protein
MKHINIPRTLFLTVGAFGFLSAYTGNAVANAEPYARVVGVVPLQDESADSRTLELMQERIVARTTPSDCTASTERNTVCRFPDSPMLPGLTN